MAEVTGWQVLHFTPCNKASEYICTKVIVYAMTFFIVLFKQKINIIQYEINIIQYEINIIQYYICLMKNLFYFCRN